MKDYQEKWGVEETNLAIKMLERGAMLGEISERVGRSYEAVRKRFKRIGVKLSRTQTAIRIEERKRIDRRPTKYVVRPRVEKMPQHLMREAEARRNEPRTIGMEQFGDPPPSQSALGRRTGLTVDQLTDGLLAGHWPNGNLGSNGPRSVEPSRPGSAPAVGATIQK